MLGELYCKGFKAVLLAYCANRDGLLYMRLLAPPTADKAIWAVLNSAKARRGSRLETVKPRWPNDRYSWGISMARGQRYLSPRVVLPCGYTDMAFIHPDATTNAGKTFYLVSEEPCADEPPPAFFPMLNARLSLPLLPQWAAWLWTKGLETKVGSGWQTLVNSVEAKGVQVYRVDAREDVAMEWLGVIRQGLGFDLAQWAEGKAA
jgi:hypothetical protein